MNKGTDMTLEETLAFIHSTSWKGSQLGLGRMRDLLHRVGDPQEHLKFIHVAGTNGKGSVCAMLAAILTSAGYRTGLYTSPHLWRVHERMNINGCEISNSGLLAMAGRVKQATEQMEEPPTEFELITAMALTYFWEQHCDIVVLEVGLGGRLDATNCIPTPEVAVLMNIGLEHTEMLGDTLEKIAFEKAGIIKEHGTVVAYRVPTKVEAVFQQVCEERDAEFHLARFKDIVPRSQSFANQRFDWREYQNLTLGLLGPHQVYNAVVALETVGQLRVRGWNIGESAVRDGLANVRWPARMELLHQEPLFLLDGAHNPQCMETLVTGLQVLLPKEKVVFLTGVLGDKDYPQMMATAFPLAKTFVCLTPDSERALPAKDLVDYLRKQGFPAVACQSAKQGIETALRLAEGSAIVACGSLYMAGTIREMFQPAFRNWQRHFASRRERS